MGRAKYLLNRCCDEDGIEHRTFETCFDREKCFSSDLSIDSGDSDEFSADIAMEERMFIAVEEMSQLSSCPFKYGKTIYPVPKRLSQLISLSRSSLFSDSPLKFLVDLKILSEEAVNSIISESTQELYLCDLRSISKQTYEYSSHNSFIESCGAFALKEILMVCHSWAFHHDLFEVAHSISLTFRQVIYIYKCMRKCFSHSMKSVSHELGGDNFKHVVEVEVIKIAQYGFLAALDQQTGLVRIKIFRFHNDLNCVLKHIIERLILWLKPKSCVITSSMRLKSAISKEFETIDSEITTTSNSCQPLPLSLLHGIKQWIPIVMKKFNVQSFQMKQVQGFLNELEWRQRFGSCSVTAFVNILNLILEQNLLIDHPEDMTGVEYAANDCKSQHVEAHCSETEEQSQRLTTSTKEMCGFLNGSNIATYEVGVGKKASVIENFTKVKTWHFSDYSKINGTKMELKSQKLELYSLEKKLEMVVLVPKPLEWVSQNYENRSICKAVQSTFHSSCQFIHGLCYQPCQEGCEDKTVCDFPNFFLNVSLPVADFMLIIVHWPSNADVQNIMRIHYSNQLFLLSKKLYRTYSGGISEQLTPLRTSGSVTVLVMKFGPFFIFCAMDLGSEKVFSNVYDYRALTLLNAIKHSLSAILTGLTLLKVNHYTNFTTVICHQNLYSLMEYKAPSTNFISSVLSNIFGNFRSSRMENDIIQEMLDKEKFWKMVPGVSSFFQFILGKICTHSGDAQALWRIMRFHAEPIEVPSIMKYQNVSRTIESSQNNEFSYYCIFCHIEVLGKSNFMVHVHHHVERLKERSMSSQNIIKLPDSTVRKLLYSISYGNCAVCMECKALFETEKDLGIHFINVHNNGLILCKVCSQAFNSLQRVFQHFEETHKDKPDLICPICSHHFPFQDCSSSVNTLVFSKHLLHHNYCGMIYSCLLCLQNFPSSFECENHLKNFHRIARSYSEEETNQKKIIFHKRSSNDTSSGSTVSDIDEKDKITHKKKRAKKVKKKRSSDTNANLGGALLSAVQSLSGSINMFRNSEKVPISQFSTVIQETTQSQCKHSLKNVEKYLYKCDFCSYNFDERFVLLTHIMDHISNKKKNSILSQKFRDDSMNSKKSKMRNRSYDFVYGNFSVCLICDLMCDTDDELLNHICSKHHTSGLYCPICGVWLKKNMELLFHYDEEHQDVRSLLCPICLDEISCKKRMNSSNTKDFCQHVLSHHYCGVAYCCLICHKHFLSSSAVKNHVNENHLSSSSFSIPSSEKSDSSDYSFCTEESEDSAVETINSMPTPLEHKSC